ncbi:MAG: amino acid--tRNA ligase-related protein [Enhygromyxa sp.]
MTRGLGWPLRVQVWDAALDAVRSFLRGQGLREVSTGIRSGEVALEPWIDPLRAGEQWLATSPELAMKRLLARGAGSIFQIAHVFRAAEIGARHREEFHLIEWYRTPGDLPDVIADVEGLVAAVFEAVSPLLGAHRPPAPRSWRRVELLELMGETLGARLAGDEPLAAIKPVLERVRHELGVGLRRGDEGDDDSELARLLAWTELFSLWSDAYLDPWLAQLPAELAVHVVGFPASLAALSELEPGGRRAARFESHVAGVELANGYRELRDPREQRRRFELVAAMRARHAQPPLPMPEAFLAELDRLPPCAGVALGLDRLLALACGCTRLDEVGLALD